jgi:lipoate-protein ligase B
MTERASRVMSLSAIALYLNDPVRYADGVRFQEALVAARQADQIPDTVLFLQHHPVITLGRRGRTQHLLASPDALARHGVDLATSSRGGDVTYHGPGQLVMYPILKLGSAEADSHGYLTNLEEIAVRTASDFGVTAYRRPGMNGAWTDAGKIAAIGFYLKRWVTMHGMSFNVDLDLAGFQLIVGCGLVGEKVSSLRQILGDRGPSLETVRDHLARHAEQVLGRTLNRDLAASPALAQLVVKSGLLLL